MLNISTMGTKRGLGLDPDDYETVRVVDGEEARRLETAFARGEAGVSAEDVKAAQRGSLKLARRCTQLVPSTSRSNPHPNKMSAPLYPKWVEKAPHLEEPPDENDGVFQELHEQAQVFQGVRGHE
jgi:hypothetical protein